MIPSLLDGPPSIPTAEPLDILVLGDHHPDLAYSVCPAFFYSEILFSLTEVSQLVRNGAIEFRLLRLKGYHGYGPTSKDTLGSAQADIVISAISVCAKCPNPVSIEDLHAFAS